MSTATDRERTVAQGGVYLYGIVRASLAGAPDLEGVSGGSLELLRCGELAALLSTLPERGWKVKRRDLERHLDVLEAAFAQTTILPCPFGTVVASREELEDMLLVGRRDELLDGLARLDGRVQLNVKALYDEDELLRRVVASNREIARLRERTRGTGDAGYYERVRLGELIAAAVEDHRARDSARIKDVLARAALDVAPEEGAGEAAFRAAFLVDRSSLGEFDALLEATAAAEQPLLRFEAIGPLPPTAFAASYAEL